MSRFFRGFMEGVSFKRKLFAVIVVLSLAPIPLFGVFSYYTISNSIKKEVDLNHQMILNQIENHVDEFLQSLAKSSLEIASNPAIDESIHLGISIEHYLDQSLLMTDTLQQFRSASDISFDASLVYSKFDKVYSNRYGYIDLNDFPYRNVVENNPIKYNGFVVISPNTYPNQNEILIVRSIPASRTPGEGMLFLHVNANNLTAFLKQMNIGGKILYILDSQGKVVASSSDEHQSDMAASVHLFQFWNNAGETSNHIRWNGLDYDLSAFKSSFSNWTFITMTPTAELNRQLFEIKSVTWICVIVLSAIWVLLALVGSNRLYVPLQRLLTKFSPKPAGRTDAIKMLDLIMIQMQTANTSLEDQLREQKPYLKESVFLRMLRGEMSDKEFRKETEHYGFPIKGNWFYSCVVEVDQFLFFQKTYREKDRSLIMYALSKMVEEISSEAYSSAAVITRSGQVALMIGLEKAGDETDRTVRGIGDTIRYNVAQYFQFTVSVAISEAKQNYHSCIDGYHEALDLIGFRFLLGNNVTITQGNIATSTNKSSWKIIESQKLIMQSIAQGDFAYAEEQLVKLVCLIPENIHNTETVLAIFAYFIAELDSFIHRMGYAMEEFFEDDLYKHLYSLTSLEDVKQWLSDTVFHTIRIRLDSMQIIKQKRLIQQVLLHIDENFETDLSLQQIADTFQVSTGLLGRAFKDELDTNFTQYLIHYRIDKAKEWLIHSDMSIKEIAERLRYTQVHNFTRIFAKTTGMPPGLYRKQYYGSGNGPPKSVDASEEED